MDFWNGRETPWAVQLACSDGFIANVIANDPFLNDKTLRLNEFPTAKAPPPPFPDNVAAEIAYPQSLCRIR